MIRKFAVAPSTRTLAAGAGMVAIIGGRLGGGVDEEGGAGHAKAAAARKAPTSLWGCWSPDFGRRHLLTSTRQVLDEDACRRQRGYIHPKGDTAEDCVAQEWCSSTHGRSERRRADDHRDTGLHSPGAVFRQAHGGQAQNQTTEQDACGEAADGPRLYDGATWRYESS